MRWPWSKKSAVESQRVNSKNLIRMVAALVEDESSDIQVIPGRCIRVNGHIDITFQDTYSREQYRIRTHDSLTGQKLVGAAAELVGYAIEGRLLKLLRAVEGEPQALASLKESAGSPIPKLQAIIADLEPEEVVEAKRLVDECMALGVNDPEMASRAAEAVAAADLAGVG